MTKPCVDADCIAELDELESWDFPLSMSQSIQHEPLLFHKCPRCGARVCGIHAIAAELSPRGGGLDIIYDPAICMMCFEKESHES